MSIRSSRLIFGGLFLAIFVYAGWDALSFPRLARYLPLYVSVAGAVLTLVYLLVEVVNGRRRPTSGQARAALPPSTTESDEAPVMAALAEASAVDPDSSPPWGRAGYFLAWTVGFAAAIWILDVRAAAPLFVAAFLFIESDVRRPRTLLLASAGALLGLIAIGGYMQLRWPGSLIQIPL